MVPVTSPVSINKYFIFEEEEVKEAKDLIRYSKDWILRRVNAAMMIINIPNVVTHVTVSEI